MILSHAVASFSMLLMASLAGIAHGAPRNAEPIRALPSAPAVAPAMAELGKMLFFDPRLSKSGAISCNSCHNLATGGVDNLTSSIGHGWQIGPINSPTVLNAGLHLAQFWDGRAADLKEQAGGPIANPGEMASSHTLAVQTIQSISGYASHFKAAFGDEKVDIDRITTAIASFESTLLTPGAKFDRWLGGDDNALTAEELRGYEHFKQKGCVGCHAGPVIGGEMYQKFGLVHPYTRDTKNVGRFAVTKQPQDKFVFKVPSLRNIELTYPYFHDGSVWTLSEAVDVMAWHQLGIKLSKTENSELVAFLKSLTGQQPRIELPILPPSGENTPRPKQQISVAKMVKDSQ